MRVDFPPGISHQVSRRRNQVSWREANLVRWSGETLNPVGGWSKVGYADFGSPIKKIHRWIDNSGNRHIAYLCEEHCYVDSGDGVLNDITPVDGFSPAPIGGQGGYGDELYGVKPYGTPRAPAERYNPLTPVFTLDNWGQELRAMTSTDGRLLRWDPSEVGAKLTAVPNAPTNNRTFVVTPERTIILFGAGGVKSQFMWSDQENDTNWTPGTTSKAGSYSVEPAAHIVSCENTPVGTVMFTTRSAYIIKYIGLPFVYSYEKIADCPPPLSPGALAPVPYGLVWMAHNGFWKFDGSDVTPLPCSVWDWVKNNRDEAISQILSSAYVVHGNFEVWFNFVGVGDLNNSRVAVFNYKENIWTMGYISRNCGNSVPNDPNPLMAMDKVLYKHEVGFEYPGSPMPWIESHVMNIAAGVRLSTIRQMLPEISGDLGSVQFKVIKLNNPNDPASKETESAPKPIRSNGYVDVRETARDFRLRVEMVAPRGWSLGPIDVDMTGRGFK